MPPLSPASPPFIGMTTPRYTAGRPLGPPRVLVLHATAGRHPGDLAWLSKGGTDKLPISCHYYIDKRGGVVQLVRDEDSAWHCGAASWVVDGQSISGSHGGVGKLNLLSLGIELENLNDGRDPYPPAQVMAAVALSRALVTRYRIPRSQMVRHLDISPGRKTDPAGLAWGLFAQQVYASDATYTPHSRILGRPLGTQAQAERWFGARSTQYDAPAIATIVNAYAREGEGAGVDWFLALAQCAHETGSLTSHLSGEGIFNYAGIGVTGRWSPVPSPGFVWDEDRKAYRACVVFPTIEAGVRAHLGRLVAYAVASEHRMPYQRMLADEALAWRPLPPRLHGFAPTISGLDRHWAVGVGYGERVTAVAEKMRGL